MMNLLEVFQMMCRIRPDACRLTYWCPYQRNLYCFLRSYIQFNWIKSILLFKKGVSNGHDATSNMTRYFLQLRHQGWKDRNLLFIVSFRRFIIFAVNWDLDKWSIYREKNFGYVNGFVFFFHSVNNFPGIPVV